MVEYKQSDIDHHEAGDGIFVKTHNGQSLLPGTLLGFYPGIIRSPSTPKPKHDEDFINFNTKRYDNFWIDSENLIPYPAKFNLPMTELFTRITTVQPQADPDEIIEFIDPEFLNPYAVGHKINHPPPGVAANTELVDFDIPFTWFPQEYRIHLPYIDEKEYIEGPNPARKQVLRGVAVMAARFIEDGEELYFDYFKEAMASNKIAEDWLVTPPPVSPYLAKKTIFAEVPLFFRVMLGIRDVSSFLSIF